MMYPAKLRVHTGRKPLFFTDAHATMKYAKQNAKKHRQHTTESSQDPSQMSDND